MKLAATDVRSAAPETGHWCYIARSADGSVLYVGMTIQPRTRLVTHSKTADWWADCCSVELVACTSEIDSLRTERRLIHELEPSHNREAHSRPGRFPELDGELQIKLERAYDRARSAWKLGACTGKARRELWDEACRVARRCTAAGYSDGSIGQALGAGPKLGAALRTGLVLSRQSLRF